MTNALRPITREYHATKRFKRFPDYRFAATRTVAPLAGAEIAKAAFIFPLAFVEVAGTWSLAAMLGLTPGKNLFVAPNGRWVASYVPAVFRSYPFQLVRGPDARYALHIDETSGLVVEGEEGTPFFDEAGKPSEPVQQALSFLTQIAQSGETLSRACTALAQQGVVEPWAMTIQDGDQPRQVGRLHRINEDALNGLSDEDFLVLRRVGALPVAYAQLLSTSNLTNLARLAQAHAQVEAQQTQTTGETNIDLDQTFGIAGDETVDWSAVNWDE